MFTSTFVSRFAFVVFVLGVATIVWWNLCVMIPSANLAISQQAISQEEMSLWFQRGTAIMLIGIGMKLFWNKK